MVLGVLRASAVAALVFGACAPRAAAPSRPPSPAKSTLPKQVVTPRTEEPEPAVCEFEDHYEDATFLVSLEADSRAYGSRFVAREEGACGDATLVLASDRAGATLTMSREGQSAVVFRDTKDFVLFEGCVDLTGDGVPELVVHHSGAGSGSGSIATRVVSLGASPRTLLDVPFDLELRKTRTGPYGYELVNDDALVYTEPRLPLVYAHRNGRFERVGATDREYWRGRRDRVKKVLECNAKTPEPVPRVFANAWFATSLYVGDWDEERRAFRVDPAQALEFELARPLLEKGLADDAKVRELPPSVWLASKHARAEVKTMLSALSALPPPPQTTEAEDFPVDEDSTPPPGFRFLRTPTGRGALLEKCGDYVVEQVSEDELEKHVRLRNAAGAYAGRILPAVSFGSVSAEWCFDLTRDGIPELLVTESSGGAHCCHTFRVISLGPTPELLLEFDAGNGWLEGPENVDGTGAFELLGRDDFLVNDASASPYAATYFVPVVFAFENGKYVRKTRRFKKLLEREREELAADYRSEDARGMSDDPSGWMALSLLIGDWEKVKPRLPIQPSAKTWFDPETTLQRILRDIER
jgi:hypothetical protein